MEDKFKLFKAILNSEKSTLLDKLASTIAHEINNPIMVISNLVSLLLDDIKSKGGLQIEKGDPNFRDLQEVLNACERIKNITQKLGDLSEKPKKSCEIVELEELIIRSLKYIEPEIIKSQINLSMDFQSENLKSFINALDIQRVLISIIENSIHAVNKKYSDKSRSFENNVHDQKTIKITLRKENSVPMEDQNNNNILGNEKKVSGNAPSKSYAVIDIFDDGVGMDKEVKEKIGEPFFTTKKSKSHQKVKDGSGLGLGLHSCIQIMKANRGYISFKSKEGKYSCFHLYFPLYSEEGENTPIKIRGNKNKLKESEIRSEKTDLSDTEDIVF